MGTPSNTTTSTFNVLDLFNDYEAFNSSTPTTYYTLGNNQHFQFTSSFMESSEPQELHAQTKDDQNCVKHKHCLQNIEIPPFSSIIFPDEPSPMTKSFCSDQGDFSFNGRHLQEEQQICETHQSVPTMPLKTKKNRKKNPNRNVPPPISVRNINNLTIATAGMIGDTPNNQTCTDIKHSIDESRHNFSHLIVKDCNHLEELKKENTSDDTEEKINASTLSGDHNVNSPSLPTKNTTISSQCDEGNGEDMKKKNINSATCKMPVSVNVKPARKTRKHYINFFPDKLYCAPYKYDVRLRFSSLKQNSINKEIEQQYADLLKNNLEQELDFILLDGETRKRIKRNSKGEPALLIEKCKKQDEEEESEEKDNDSKLFKKEVIFRLCFTVCSFHNYRRPFLIQCIEKQSEICVFESNPFHIYARKTNKDKASDNWGSEDCIGNMKILFQLSPITKDCLEKCNQNEFVKDLGQKTIESDTPSETSTCLGKRKREKMNNSIQQDTSTKDTLESRNEEQSPGKKKKSNHKKQRSHKMVDRQHETIGTKSSFGSDTLKNFGHSI